MSLLHLPSIRIAFLAFCCLAPLAQAQTATQPAPGAPLPQEKSALLNSRQNQTIQHIHVEDGGAKVDEVRYGGQTQSISVQPKANVPGYEVLPNDGGRERQGSAETSSGGNGPRVWNVMKF
jgi:hypothetical protein